MPETENIANMNLTSSLVRTSSLIEQLAKAYIELEAQEDGSCDNIQLKDIEAHFHFLESVMKKKVEELEAKEKKVIEKESLLAEREAAVTAKEQDLFDKVQEVKDAAVAAIMEAKVSWSVDDENPEAQNVAAELTQFCERMDSKGLLKYVTENLNEFSSVCRKQLSVVLVRATEPAQLVLDAVEGFFPPNEMTQNGKDALRGMRLSCLLLMEALSTALAKADSHAENYLNPKTKQHAKAIADEWKPKLALESTDAANGKSLEARAFLRLLVTFRIASEFDEEELCEYILATAHHRQATELCHSLELSRRLTGMIDTLIKDKRNIEAVNFILSFQLSEAYPPVPLLKTYLKELRRNLQGNGNVETQSEFNARELTAIKAVMRCVKEYKLEAEYPLDPLRKRLVQLQNSVSDRKRKRERVKFGLAESQGIRQSLEPAVSVSENCRQGQHRFLGERAAYTGLSEYSPAVLSGYNYPVSSQAPYTIQANDKGAYNYSLVGQSTFAAQANDQRSYYFSEGDKSSAPYSVGAPTYSAYVQPPQPPYM